MAEVNGRKRGRPAGPRLSFDPVARLARTLGGPAPSPRGFANLARITGIDRRQLLRWRTTGITPDAARHICEAAGVNPRDWWTETEWVEETRRPIN